MNKCYKNSLRFVTSIFALLAFALSARARALVLHETAATQQIDWRKHLQAQLDAQLMKAIRLNDLTSVKCLLKQGASPNAAEFDRPDDQTVAAGSGLSDLFELEPPTASTVGLAAAWIGSYQDSMDFDESIHNKDVVDNRAILSLLLNAGADLNRQDVRGDTPIIIAVGDGNREAARLLIRYHARLDLKANEQRVSLGEWLMEPGLERPGTNHIMRCELLYIIDEERKESSR